MTTTPATESKALGYDARLDPTLEAIESYHARLVLDQKCTWPAAAIIAILSIILTTWWGTALAAVIAVMALVRTRAFRPLADNDLHGAVKWVAIGTWGVAIGVVAIIPAAFPIMVINLVSPLLVAAINLDARQVRRMMIVGVAVGVVLGVLGFRSNGTDLDEVAPDWFLQLIMIAYLVAHVILIGSLVRESNQVRLLGINRVRDAHEDMRRSRARVVTAADAERERIERNIHDGAQQRLVALAVQLRLAAQLSEQGEPTSVETLTSLHDETRDAIDELRELARGIYPAVLTERGVVQAIDHLGRTAPNDVEVTCDDAAIADLDIDHAAMYFVCAEALQNVAKHCSPDTSVTIDIVASDHMVTTTISDTGSGFDIASASTSRGMLNMTDRAEAAGGSLAVTSTQGDGTQIVLSVPSPAVSK